MTPDELRAAAERYRHGRYKDDDNRGDQQDWEKDVTALAEAYLAEHPADDAKPLTWTDEPPTRLTPASTARRRGDRMRGVARPTTTQG